MADTPKNSDQTPSDEPQGSTTDGAAPKAEKVTVSSASPETVDAEIVDDGRPENGVGDETVIGADGDEVRDDEVRDGGRPASKKRRGIGGWIAALAALALIAAVVLFFVDFDRDGPVVAGEEEGVVVTEAEPFPDNELDAERPIRGEAAPGTRDAAERADAAAMDDLRPSERRAREAAAAAIAAETADGDIDVDREASNEQRENALIAQAAERNRARREARERAAMANQAQEEDPDVSEAVREARAAQERIRREDERRARLEAERRAEATERPARVAAEPVVPPTTRQREIPDFEPRRQAQAPVEERPLQDGDPNFVIPGVTAPREPRLEADEDPNFSFGAERERQDERPAITRRREQAAEQPDRQAQDQGQGQVRGQPQRIDPRPAVVAVPTAPREPTPRRGDVDLDQRLDAVRADVREEVLAELRGDLRGELREDVLADTQAVVRNAIQQTEAEVQALRRELSEQEQRSNQRIAQLQDRLEVLQSRDVGATQQGVLILALSSLGSELEQGRPFERQLDDVERLAPNARSLNVARRYAAAGLPTQQELRQDFQLAARRALSNARRDRSDGVFERFWANIRGLFTVRQVGEVEGDTPSAVISRAEAALERGDLSGAVQQLRRLDGPAAEAFAPWMEEASTKALVQQRIDELERAVLVQTG